LSGRQGQGHQTQPNLNGQLNVYMCIKSEVDTTYGCLDIEADVKMLTYSDRQTDRQANIIIT